MPVRALSFPAPPVRTRRMVATLGAVLHALPIAAIAANEPRLSGTLWIDLQNDYQAHSDDPTDEYNNTLLSIEKRAALRLADGLKLNAGLIYELVQLPAVQGSNRFVDDHGAYVKSLNLEYGRDNWAVSGGKMHVDYGRAWSITPGIYGLDQAYDYEMAGNVALKGSYTFDAGGDGKHRIGVQSFFLDTSGLAESAITRRRKTRQGAGGPGNTGDFSSYAATLEGGAVKWLPGFAYHAAYVHMANDTVDAKSEQRWVLSGDWAHDLGHGYKLAPLVEYAFMRDSEGSDGQSRDFLTLALSAIKGPWNVALAATFKETVAADATETREQSAQVSAGYDFGNGFSCNLGFKKKRNAGVDTDIFGALVSHALDY